MVNERVDRNCISNPLDALAKNVEYMVITIVDRKCE